MKAPQTHPISFFRPNPGGLMPIADYEKVTRFAEPEHQAQHFHFYVRTRLQAVFLSLLLAAATPAVAQSYFWDQNGDTSGTGGTGNWNGGSTWRDGSETGTLGLWTNANAAVLAGTAGVVTINTASVSMTTLTVNTSGYTITSTASSRTLSATTGLILADSTALALNQSSTAAGNWSLGNITFGSGASLTLQGNANAGNANRVSLNQASNTVSGGSLVFAGNGLGPTGVVSTATGVVLNTNITNNAANSHTMLGATSGNTLNYGGVVSGSSGLQISAGESGGEGIVTLSAASNYSGNTFLNHATNGVFRMGVANALPAGTTVTLGQSSATGGTAASGTLDLAGFALSIAGIQGTGRGVVNTGAATTLTLGGAGSYSYSGQIGVPTGTTNLAGANNNIAVVKNGVGTQTLTAASTYSGGTTLSAGTLLVTNATGSATGTGNVTTAASSTLGGTGTLSPTGTNNVIIGGSVAPGIPGVTDGIGKLTFTPVGGDVSVSGTADLEVLTGGLHGYTATYNPDGTLASLSGSYTAGGNDQIAFAGGAAANKLDFTGVSAGNVNVTFAGGYTAAYRDLFDLLDWSNLSGTGTLNNETSAIAGLSSGQLDLPSLSGGLAWDTSFWTSHGVIAIYMLVPEPSHMILLGLGMLAAIARRRRVG